jgi:membrane protease YdiL (CAAX protease family)
MNGQELLLLSAVVSAAVAIPASLVLARCAFRLSWTELGFTAPRPLLCSLVGVLLGMSVLLLPAAIGYWVGGFSPGSSLVPEGLDALTGVAVVLPALAVAALAEELVLRGFLLQLSRRYLGKWAALLLTSALFALLHAANPGVSALGLLGAAIAGLWLGLAFLESGSLAFAAGLHLGWNAASAVVLGLPVSGLALPSMLRWVPSEDPAVQTVWGGDYGPEEGIAFHIALALAAVSSAWIGRRLRRR